MDNNDIQFVEKDQAPNNRSQQSEITAEALDKAEEPNALKGLPRNYNDRWSESEERVLAKCIAEANTIAEGSYEASRILDRTHAACRERVNYRRTRIRELVKKFAEDEQEEPSSNNTSKSSNASVKEVTKTDEAINITMETDTGIQISISIK